MSNKSDDRMLDIIIFVCIILIILALLAGSHC
jgi:hypothetical protein